MFTIILRIQSYSLKETIFLHLFLRQYGHQVHGRKSDWSMLEGYKPDALYYDKNWTDSLKTGPFPKRGSNAVMLRLYHTNNTEPQYCYGDGDGYRVSLMRHFP